MSKEPKIEVVQGPEDATDADLIVCIRALDNQPLLLADNLMGFCSRCDHKVQHRPHIPAGPKLICAECAMPELQAEMDKGEDVTFMVTPRTVQEVAEYFRKQRRD